MTGPGQLTAHAARAEQQSYRQAAKAERDRANRLARRLDDVADKARMARVATSKRDRAIAAARAQGVSLGDLATAAGMSKSGIVRVLERTND